MSDDLVRPLSGEIQRADERPRVEPWPVIVERWLDSYTSPRTREGYGREARTFTEWCMEKNLDPRTVRRHEIEAYRNERGTQQLHTDGSVKRKADSARTISRRLAALSSLFDYGGGYGLTGNPVTGVKRPKINRLASPSQSIEHNKVKVLLDTAKADSPRSGALIALLLYSGLRVSEALAANVEDLGSDDGHRVLSIRAKGGAEDLIALSREVVNAVAKAVGGRTSGPILVTSTGAAMDRRHAHRTVQRLAKKAGIVDWQKIGPHDLRHTAVTGVLKATKSIDAGQRFARHASPNTTMIYDHREQNLSNHPAYKLEVHFAEPEPER